MAHLGPAVILQTFIVVLLTFGIHARTVKNVTDKNTSQPPRPKTNWNIAPKSDINPRLETDRTLNDSHSNNTLEEKAHRLTWSGLKFQPNVRFHRLPERRRRRHYPKSNRTPLHTAPRHNLPYMSPNPHHLARAHHPHPSHPHPYSRPQRGGGFPLFIVRPIRLFILRFPPRHHPRVHSLPGSQPGRLPTHLPTRQPISKHQSRLYGHQLREMVKWHDIMKRKNQTRRGVAVRRLRVRSPVSNIHWPLRRLRKDSAKKVAASISGL